MDKRKIISNISLFYIFCIFVSGALLSESVMQTPIYTYTTMILGAFLIFSWFIYDSRARDYKPSAFLKFGVVFVAIIALPIYMIKTQGLIATIKTILFYMLKIVGVFIVALIFLFVISYLGIGSNV